MADLRVRYPTAALALAFYILTASGSSEVLHALAHRISGKAEAAHWRGDQFETAADDKFRSECLNA